jgi:AraC-like DNA-binding protein
MPLTPWISTESVVAGVWSCDGRTVPAPAVEPALVMLVPRAGSLLERVGPRSTAVLPATALIIDAGETLTLRSTAGSRVQATVVSLPDGSGHPRAPCGLQALSPRALLAHHRIQRAERDGTPPFAREELALELAAAIGGTAVPDGVRLTPALQAAARAALALVMTSGTPPSLTVLARATGVAPWPLSRAMRALLGVPLREYLVRRRLADALEQMAASPRRPISEIAHAAGFASHAHFTDVVRARFGVPPRALAGDRIPPDARVLRPSAAHFPRS